MSTKKPEPYAPDMFSEHARLAQLGARVLEILKERAAAGGTGFWADKIETAARSLGLLGEEARQ